MVPYADADPDRAFVLPSSISVAVTPTSVCAAGGLEPPHAARMTKAASAARRDPVVAIEIPPTLNRILFLAPDEFQITGNDPIPDFYKPIPVQFARQAANVQLPDRKRLGAAFAAGCSRT